MPGSPWTPADRQALRTLAADGCGQAEAAAELGRTVRAVQMAGQRLGVRFRRGPRPDVAARLALVDLLKQGLTLSAIARRGGPKLARVWSLVRELVAGGLVQRTGGASSRCRYVPVG